MKIMKRMMKKMAWFLLTDYPVDRHDEKHCSFVSGGRECCAHLLQEDVDHSQRCSRRPGNRRSEFCQSEFHQPQNTQKQRQLRQTGQGHMSHSVSLHHRRSSNKREKGKWKKWNGRENLRKKRQPTGRRDGIQGRSKDDESKMRVEAILANGTTEYEWEKENQQ